MTQTSPPEASTGPLVRVRRVVVDACPDPVTFTVPPGAAVVLVEDGARAGSVILRLLARVSPVRSGRVEVLGHDPAALTGAQRAAVRRRLGFVPRNLALDEDLSVFETVALAAVAVGRRPAEYRRSVLELLSWVGLGRKGDISAGALDAAGRHRLALARALVNQPDVLLADEPGGGLAGEARRGVLRLVAELHGAGTAVLMTSADDALASRSGAQLVRLTRQEAGGQTDEHAGEAVAGAA